MQMQGSLISTTLKLNLIRLTTQFKLSNRDRVNENHPLYPLIDSFNQTDAHARGKLDLEHLLHPHSPTSKGIGTYSEG
ncbi:hypothetical protein COLO4_29302 [Corchorus olitorius]|uniref:Uncharacterized protein n=1 Tax=Corchorus olitorius TaxID=93759 RepID=A0A1R3HFA1_9ROSI|nr:hypothetical protein COLO4_29302 [Corchorus olitorius]